MITQDGAPPTMPPSLLQSSRPALLEDADAEGASPDPQPRPRSMASVASSGHLASTLEDLVTQQVKLKPRIVQEQKALLDATYLLEHTRAAVVDINRQLGGVQSIQKRSSVKRHKLARAENRIQNLAVALSKAARHNAQLKERVNQLRLQRLQHAGEVDKVKRELARKKDATRAMLKELATVKELTERTHEEFDTMKSKTVEEIEQFGNDIASLKTEMQPKPVTPKLNTSTIAPPSVLLHKHYQQPRPPPRDASRPPAATAFAAVPQPAPAAAPSSGNIITGTGGADSDEPTPVAVPQPKGPWKPPTLLTTKTTAATTDTDAEQRQARLEQQERQRQAAAENQRRRELSEAFKRVRQDAQVESIDDLLARHVANEERNFQALQEFNALNVELEALEAERAVLERTHADLDQQTETMKRNLANSGFATLDKDLEAATALRARFESKYQEDNALIGSVQDSLAALIDTLTAHGGGYGNDQVAELLQQQLAEGVNERNITQFLSFIEDKITFVLQIVPNNPSDGAPALQIPAPKTAPDGTRLCSVDVPLPPNFCGEDFGDEVGEDEPQIAPLRVREIKTTIADNARSTESLGTVATNALSMNSKRRARKNPRAMAVRSLGYEGPQSDQRTGLLPSASIKRSRPRIPTDASRRHFDAASSAASIQSKASRNSK